MQTLFSNSVKQRSNQLKGGFTSGIYQSGFKPPEWAKNKHIQPLWPRFVQKRLSVHWSNERLELPDGDFVDLAWATKPAHCKGIVVLFHGLEGSIRSHYANDMMSYLYKHNWWPVLMHFRGCSGVSNRLPRAYHSGDTGDALYFLQILQSRFPTIPKVAVGFSLGANMLLKLLGENPSQPFIRAAVAISAPMKLAECADAISQGMSRIYQDYLLKSMKTKFAQKLARMSLPFDLSVAQLNQTNNFRQFDDLVTAPLHGFDGVNDYYHRCSAAHYLSKIQTDSLILHAVDDPFMNKAVIPDQSDLSQSTRLELSDTGGHVGFMQGMPWDPTIWTHQRTLDFFDGYS
jgi:predicted alpha/beta-fold hydrolase